MTTNTWHAWFDGATKHTNPGIRGVGALLKGPDGQHIEIAQEIGHGTNNEAEYCALMAVLDAAVEAQVQDLVVYGDSQLVIKQVTGEWLINAPGLVPFCKTVQGLKAQIPQVRFIWIPREENSEADALSKRAIGVAAPQALDRSVWMKITEIGKPFRLVRRGAGQADGCRQIARRRQADPARPRQGLCPARREQFWSRGFLAPQTAAGRVA